METQTLRLGLWVNFAGRLVCSRVFIAKTIRRTIGKMKCGSHMRQRHLAVDRICHLLLRSRQP